MSAFHKIIANVREALERKPAPRLGHDATVIATTPVSVAARRAELASQFARELERVGGVFIGAIAESAAKDQVVEVARKVGAQSAVVAEGVSVEAKAIRKALNHNKIAVVEPTRVRDDERAPLRELIAQSDLGVIEADYAIASTGTFCIVADAHRPSSVTILPPVNFIFVAADRILPTLADVVSAVGADNFAHHRIALITGPSRTADIEKMIVIGVHGPKELFAAVIA